MKGILPFALSFAGCGESLIGQPTDIVGIEIQPPDPVLDAHDGAKPTQQFTVVGHQHDGQTVPLTSGLSFSIDDIGLGQLADQTGLFTSSGLGGATRVHVVKLGTSVSAMTSLTINAHWTLLGPGVTQGDIDGLNNAPPATDSPPGIDYPLAGAVMPLNVFPPSVQWTAHHTAAANDTDLWRVRLVRPNAILEGYFREGPTFLDAWNLPAAPWRVIAESSVGQPIVTTVSVLSGGVRRDSQSTSFRTVNGVTAGSIYYWSPPEARLKRLDVDQANVVNFLPNPGDTCIGCHSVSRDGRRLAGFLERSSETLASYDLTIDLTANPAPTLFRVGYQVRRCTSFKNDGSRLVSGDCGANPTTQPFTIIDTATGTEMPALAGRAGDGFDPEWSPDGTAIAYSDRNNDLALTPAMPGDGFGTPQVLHRAASTPGGAVDWHPTWSPDSTWIAFQHGETRRTGVATVGLLGSAGSLWILPRAGGAPVRLDHASGPNESAFRPVFSPFDSGGYFWLLFTTTRDYGNARAGIHGLKQIWVAAIKHQPGLTDPSETPYYLSGQEATTVLSPFWAPPACRPTGQGCSQSPECCSGLCDPDQHSCNPGSVCHPRGGTCGSDADCCNGLRCNGAHICDLPLPN